MKLHYKWLNHTQASINLDKKPITDVIMGFEDGRIKVVCDPIIALQDNSRRKWGGKTNSYRSNS